MRADRRACRITLSLAGPHRNRHARFRWRSRRGATHFRRRGGGDPRAPPLRTSRDRGGRPDRWAARLPALDRGGDARPERGRGGRSRLALGGAGGRGDRRRDRSPAGRSCCPPSRRSGSRRARSTPKTVEVRFNVADGYYLYRDKLRFAVEPAPVARRQAPSCRPASPTRTSSSARSRPTAGSSSSGVPIASAKPGQDVTLVVGSQGCADVGVCYPPQLQRVALTLPRRGAGPSPAVEAPPAKPAYFK